MKITLKEQGADYKVRPKIIRPESAAEQLKEMAGEEQEAFLVLSLDSKNGMKAADVVTVGLVDSSLVHPREVFRAAISRSATAVILAHNHPSGDTTPSAEDLRVTKILVDAGRIIDIKVLDHIIIGITETGLKWHSIRESGLVSFA